MNEIDLFALAQSQPTRVARDKATHSNTRTPFASPCLALLCFSYEHPMDDFYRKVYDKARNEPRPAGAPPPPAHPGAPQSILRVTHG